MPFLSHVWLSCSVPSTDDYHIPIILSQKYDKKIPTVSYTFCFRCIRSVLITLGHFYTFYMLSVKITAALVTFKHELQFGVSQTTKPISYKIIVLTVKVHCMSHFLLFSWSLFATQSTVSIFTIFYIFIYKQHSVIIIYQYISKSTSAWWPNVTKLKFFVFYYRYTDIVTIFQLHCSWQLNEVCKFPTCTDYVISSLFFFLSVCYYLFLSFLFSGHTVGQK